ncbi:class I SAM-dependent methyltransferase [Aurantimonas sp. HBX-1]|uniref:class I SAM-dependent methyltransferase n=1 Tax=Aurantimonas sp. HBX-1 TaxID=2906072 RepID=UPI00351D44E2
MVASTRHDAWQAGESYDAYMGRWSRPIASRFLDWLELPEGVDWLEVGCGTGALREAIVRQCAPAGVTAIDPSERLISLARARVGDLRVNFRIGDAASLARMSAVSRDVAVGGLVLTSSPIEALRLRT